MPTAGLPPLLHCDQLEALQRDGAHVRLLDVRTPGEFETAHIHGAYNVPVDALAEHADQLRAGVHHPVVLVCQSGQRARRADQLLRTVGMRNLHVLEGGMNAWMSAGRPVIRRVARIALERQVRIVAGALVAVGAILALTVNPLFALLPAFVGSGLVFAGITDFCAMGLLLARLPYNRGASCDPGAMVRALAAGSPPVAASAAAAPRSCAT
jgi:rhodanese-related sulfurtransferase